MQCDEEFNVRFVHIIRKHRCLYDKKVADYRNKDEQEKAWTDIARDTRESVSHCKERWRNLRACLSRYIKQQSSSDPQHKPYYLSEHMQFLVPFLKPHRYNGFGTGHFNFENGVNSKSDIGCSAGENEETMDTNEADISIKQALSETDTETADFPLNLEMGSMNPVEIQPEVLFTASNDPTCFPKRRRIKMEAGVSEHYPMTSSTDPDMEFFRSILPDIENMTAVQKRKFKIGVLTLIDDVYVKYPTIEPKT